jgi:hypothetical protein
MNFEEFRSTLGKPKPPASLTTPLRALWLDAKGDWKGAHDLVDDPNDSVEARVHAYLHRKEGDLANARYWYRYAGAKAVTDSLEAEWESLVRELLAEKTPG